MNGSVAIKRYFESGEHGRKTSMKEILELDKEERAELGRLACEELGVPYEPPAAK